MPNSAGGDDAADAIEQIAATCNFNSCGQRRADRGMQPRIRRHLQLNDAAKHSRHANNDHEDVHAAPLEHSR